MPNIYLTTRIRLSICIELLPFPLLFQARLGLVCRHPLPADARGLYLSGRHHGLVYEKGAGLAHLEHA